MSRNMKFSIQIHYKELHIKRVHKLLYKSAVTKYLDGESQVRATNFHILIITAQV